MSSVAADRERPSTPMHLSRVSTSKVVLHTQRVSLRHRRKRRVDCYCFPPKQETQFGQYFVAKQCRHQSKPAFVKLITPRMYGAENRRQDAESDATNLSGQLACRVYGGTVLNRVQVACPHKHSSPIHPCSGGFASPNPASVASLERSSIKTLEPSDCIRVTIQDTTATHHHL